VASISVALAFYAWDRRPAWCSSPGKDSYFTISDEEIGRYLRMVAQQGRRMSTIIEKMLLLAGVRKGGKVVMRPLDMARIVAEAQSRLAYLIEEY
jgi:hypothetical protein